MSESQPPPRDPWVDLLENPDKPKPDCLRRDMPIVSRKKWKALPSLSSEPLERSEVLHVIMSFTRTRRCTDRESCREKMRCIQKKHMDRGLPDIKYNFLVGGDGRIYEGRGWHVQPAVNKMWPEITKKTLEIAYIGNFKRPKQPPKEMVRPAWELLEVGFVKDYIGLNFTLHQRRHLPIVYNFVDKNNVLGRDYF